jgi:uncharacterized protein
MHRISIYGFIILLAGTLYACATHQSAQSMASASQAAECEKWLQSGRNGDANSQFNAGVCYEQGQLGKHDYVKAAKWYRLAAIQGNMLAETNLGYLYRNGLGVAQDYGQARDWYEKAAAQGESNAENDLGLFYEYGTSVPQNFSTALDYFRKAAEQQNTDAEVHLASLYEQGLGVAKDYDKALHWYYTAANADNTEAQYRIALMYKNGEGVARNYSAAIQWMRMAAIGGEFVAQQQLPNLLRTPGAIPQVNGQTVLTWAQSGAMQASADLQDFLGENYEFGWYAKVDKQKAIQWYKKSAEHGYAQGEFDLGNAYSFDNLTAKNYPVAMKWFRLAANQGYAPAADNIGVLFQFGFGIPVDVSKAAYWYRQAAPEIKAPECALLELHLIGAITASPDEVNTWQSDVGGEPWCQNSIAWDLSTSSVPGQLHPTIALQYIQLAINTDPGNWQYKDTLAAVYAALGKFPDAIQQEKQAIQLVQKTNSSASVENVDGLRKRLELYNSGKPYISKDAIQ